MKPVGIIGCNGDLGSQVAQLHVEAGIEIVGFDLNLNVPVNMIGKISLLNSVEDMQKSVDLIHYCAPASTVDSYPIETNDGRIVMHDSVMNNSVKASRLLGHRTYRDIQIAHMLMNDTRTVVVAEESEDPTETVRIFEALGRSGKILPADEHDTIMAGSQAIYAILHELVGKKLAAQHEEGLLTPSGEELHGALKSRAANWTPATMDSLLKNPQILPLLENAINMIRTRNGDNKK